MRSLSANIYKNEEEISQKPKKIILLKVVKKPSAYIYSSSKQTSTRDTVFLSTTYILNIPTFSREPEKSAK